MISHRIAAFSIALCAILQPIAQADSTTCNERLHYLEWAQKFFDTADSVFVGMVVAEETPKPLTTSLPSSGTAKSMADLLEMIEIIQSRPPPPPRLQTATFNVDKSWKGSIGSTITVTASLYADDTAHYPVFSAGETYLVLAYKGSDDGVLHVPIGCASHQSDDETGSKIRVLDALTKKPASP